MDYNLINLITKLIVWSSSSSPTSSSSSLSSSSSVPFCYLYAVQGQAQATMIPLFLAHFTSLTTRKSRMMMMTKIVMKMMLMMIVMIIYTGQNSFNLSTLCWPLGPGLWSGIWYSYTVILLYCYTVTLWTEHGPGFTSNMSKVKSYRHRVEILRQYLERGQLLYSLICSLAVWSHFHKAEVNATCT